MPDSLIQQNEKFQSLKSILSSLMINKLFLIFRNDVRNEISDDRIGEFARLLISKCAIYMDEFRFMNNDQAVLLQLEEFKKLMSQESEFMRNMANKNTYDWFL